MCARQPGLRLGRRGLSINWKRSGKDALRRQKAQYGIEFAEHVVKFLFFFFQSKAKNNLNVNCFHCSIKFFRNIECNKSLFAGGSVFI